MTEHTTIKFTRGNKPALIDQHLASKGNALRSFTVTIDYGDRQTQHKSMAPNWLRALDLALRNAEDFPENPPTIKIERK